MYEALDGFLTIDTWHTGHPLDEARFYRALDGIVKEQKFSAEQMGEYIRSKIGENIDATDAYWDRAVDKLVDNAWAVRTYLESTGKL